MVRKKYFVLAQLEQPRQDKIFLYRHDNLNEPTKEGPYSFVLFESPFTSISTICRGHPTLVSKIAANSWQKFPASQVEKFGRYAEMLASAKLIFKSIWSFKTALVFVDLEVRLYQFRRYSKWPFIVLSFNVAPFELCCRTFSQLATPVSGP
jgi:hypothetical protein